MQRAARSDGGQATVDYVALLGLVALVLAAGAGAVAVSGVGERLLYALRQGLCAVGGVLCPPRPSRAWSSATPSATTALCPSASCAWARTRP